VRRTHVAPGLGIAVVVLTVIAGLDAGLAASPGRSLAFASEPEAASAVAAPQVVPVLDAATGGRSPGRTQIRQALSRPLSDPALTGPVGVSVADGSSGQVRYAADAGRPLMPASTLKLLTAVTALDSLGSDDRLVTRVVMPTRGHLVLVGGGDPTLTAEPVHSGPADARPASTAALAATTARTLRRAGRRRVSLSYDASLFTGPAVNPRWPPDYVTSGVVAPVVALMVDEGRVTPTSDERVADPALSAAQTFARQLGDHGIEVVGPVFATRPKPGDSAMGRATPVASVESAPMAVIVARMLDDSDNQVAEGLGRLAALESGQPASFRGASAALLGAAVQRHLPVTGWRVFDASGLSRDDRATAGGLVATVAMAVSDPSLAPIIAGLPVAGFTGTLADRYLSRPQSSAAGVVRAKTGTLTGSSAEVGLLVTSRGRLLAFALVAGAVPAPATDAARAALDRAAAALVTAGTP